MSTVVGMQRAIALGVAAIAMLARTTSPEQAARQAQQAVQQFATAAR
jgi:hypothetical protein